MTIDRAIEILTTDLRERHPYTRPDVITAIRLGIEALKYYQEVRPLEVSSYYPLLPGETK